MTVLVDRITDPAHPLWIADQVRNDDTVPPPCGFPLPRGMTVRDAGTTDPASPPCGYWIKSRMTVLVARMTMLSHHYHPHPDPLPSRERGKLAVIADLIRNPEGGPSFPASITVIPRESVKNGTCGNNGM